MMPMTGRFELSLLLAEKQPAERQRLFGVMTLGVVESLASGVLSPDDAVRLFFHADNCLYVGKHLGTKVADEIMGRGVQLPDLFEILPAKVAATELEAELTRIRSACLKLMRRKKAAA
jgi:hypothetical protein